MGTNNILGGLMSVDENLVCSFQILKPAEKKKEMPKHSPLSFKGKITHLYD